MAKPRIAKDYDRLSEELINQIKLEYPFGFEDNLITYTDAKGIKVSALPFDTEDAYYLIRMTKLEAKRIIQEDEDYDDEGNLRGDFEEDIAADAEDESGADDQEDDEYDKADPVDDDNDDQD